jgi:hypothetical protein
MDVVIGDAFALNHDHIDRTTPGITKASKKCITWAGISHHLEGTKVR